MLLFIPWINLGKYFPTSLYLKAYKNPSIKSISGNVKNAVQ